MLQGSIWIRSRRLTSLRFPYTHAILRLALSLNRAKVCSQTPSGYHSFRDTPSLSAQDSHTTNSQTYKFASLKCTRLSPATILLMKSKSSFNVVSFNTTDFDLLRHPHFRFIICFLDTKKGLHTVQVYKPRN